MQKKQIKLNKYIYKYIKLVSEWLYWWLQRLSQYNLNWDFPLLIDYYYQMI